MATLGIIPARGGSKRLPRKNVIEFAGKPMIAWTIQAAQDCGGITDLYVSTEDREIAGIARECGARILARDDSLAGEKSTVTEVCLDAIDRLNGSNRYDTLCCLYPTAPLRNTSDIDAVLRPVVQRVANYSLAVTRYPLPPHQALRLTGDTGAEPVFPHLVDRREDEIGKWVVDNGSTYAVYIADFQKARSFFGQPLAVHVMPAQRSVDINEAADLQLARFYQAQETGKPD